MLHEGERLPNDLLRRAREARVSPSGSGRPVSRQELADAASVHLRHPLSGEYIARLERGEIRWPSKAVRDALRSVLSASNDSELGFYITRRATILPPVSAADSGGDPPDASVVTLADPSAPALEDVVTILQRVHRRQRTLDPRIVGQLSGALTELVEGYDQMDHAALIPALVRQRTWVDTLLDDCPDLQQRRDLLRVACGTAGLLGYVAVGRGSFPVARAYLTEAIGLADLAGDRDLRAWVRGTQSLAEYYAGNFRDALAYAEEGLASSGSDGRQAARLLANGVARAAGKLGDEGRARKAIDAAVDLSQTKAAGLASSVTLGPYTAAQIATNAATAFLSLGMSEQVEAYVQRALPDVERSGSPWVRSLVLIDLATALVTSRSADVDRASGLLLQALDVSAGRPIVSVTIRAKEFVQAATDRWGGARLGQMPEVRDAVAALEHGRG